jgi:hypothetical protein
MYDDFRVTNFGKALYDAALYDADGKSAEIDEFRKKTLDDVWELGTRFEPLNAGTYKIRAQLREEPRDLARSFHPFLHRPLPTISAFLPQRQGKYQHANSTRPSSRTWCLTTPRRTTGRDHHQRTGARVEYLCSLQPALGKQCDRSAPLEFNSRYVWNEMGIYWFRQIPPVNRRGADSNIRH